MFVTAYPFVYVLFGSFSDPTELYVHRGLLLAPLNFNADAYKAVFQNPMILIGYKNTLIYMVLGTCLNMIFSALFAYALSRKGVLFNKPIMLMALFTMYFSGGMIPTFLMMRDLNMINTWGAMIFPGLISVYNMIIMRTSFLQIPVSLEESAKIDGASDFTVLIRIILPLSKAMLAVITLFYAVGHWNQWFEAQLYLTKKELYPLQMVLREILIYSSTDDMAVSLGITKMGADMSLIIKYACIMVATIPVLFIYPFVHKYFEKGVMIGSVKG
jgi:putative aldouronate transport system permease protein